MADQDLQEVLDTPDNTQDFKSNPEPSTVRSGLRTY